MIKLLLILCLEKRIRAILMKTNPLNPCLSAIPIMRHEQSI